MLSDCLKEGPLAFDVKMEEDHARGYQHLPSSHMVKRKFGTKTELKNLIPSQMFAGLEYEVSNVKLKSFAQVVKFAKKHALWRS